MRTGGFVEADPVEQQGEFDQGLRCRRIVVGERAEQAHGAGHVALAAQDLGPVVEDDTDRGIVRPRADHVDQGVGVLEVDAGVADLAHQRCHEVPALRIDGVVDGEGHRSELLVEGFGQLLDHVAGGRGEPVDGLPAPGLAEVDAVGKSGDRGGGEATAPQRGRKVLEEVPAIHQERGLLQVDARVDHAPGLEFEYEGIVAALEVVHHPAHQGVGHVLLRDVVLQQALQSGFTVAREGAAIARGVHARGDRGLVEVGVAPTREAEATDLPFEVRVGGGERNGLEPLRRARTHQRATPLRGLGDGSHRQPVHGGVEPQSVSLVHVHDGVVEEADAGEVLGNRYVGVGEQQGHVGVVARRAKQADEQGRLVLAVAVAAFEHGGRRPGTQRGLAEHDPRVAHTSLDPVEQERHAPGVPGRALLVRSLEDRADLLGQGEVLQVLVHPGGVRAGHRAPVLPGRHVHPRPGVPPGESLHRVDVHGIHASDLDDGPAPIVRVVLDLLLVDRQGLETASAPSDRKILRRLDDHPCVEDGHHTAEGERCDRPRLEEGAFLAHGPHLLDDASRA